MQLSTGAWFDPLEPAEVGSLDKHGNLNVLTLDKGTSKLAQCCIAQTALVGVESTSMVRSRRLLSLRHQQSSSAD